jgi:hypothetical protein
MKKLFVALLCFPLALFSQDDNPATVYEVVNISVERGYEDAFEAAVKAHDAKFHAEAPYKAELFYNINGPNAGTYSWIMGPMKYADMENRPGEGNHDDDWDAAMEHAKAHGPSYWSFDDDLSTTAEGNDNSKRLLWVYDLKSGKGKRWAELVEQVKEVYEKKRPNESFWVVWNEFADTDAGMDAVVLFPFDEWAWMDKQSTFPKEFEEVFGPGSWHHFLNEFSDAVNGRVDWMRVRVD